MILDIIIIAVILLCVIMAYRKGLVEVAFRLISFILAIILSFTLYIPVANAIIENTEIDEKIKETFIKCVDSSAVYVNASTRFTDGGEFGLGCEMGISTQRLHARGPMGLSELNTYKYVISGNGHIR